MDIKNKVGVITGGLGGIGFKIVQSLLNNKIAYIAIFDLLKPDNEKVVESLQILEKEFDKNKFGYFSCDVTNAQEFKACFEKVVEMKKYVDIFLNNAGVLNEVNVDLNIDLNYKAVVKGTLMAIEHMRIDKGGKGGVVVNTGSTAGLQNLPATPIYNASKHAVISFVRSLKDFNKMLGVRVVCLCPDFTNTGLIGLENLEKTLLDFVNRDEIPAFLEKQHVQQPESIATAIVEIIKKGEDGAVWIADKDEYPGGVSEINEAVQLRYELSRH